MCRGGRPVLNGLDLTLSTINATLSALHKPLLLPPRRSQLRTSETILTARVAPDFLLLYAQNGLE